MIDILHLKSNVIIGNQFEGQITLTAWRDNCNEPISFNAKEPTRRPIRVIVMGVQIDYVKITTPEQINSIVYLSKNAEKIRNKILTSILEKWREIQNNSKTTTANLKNPSDLERAIEIVNIIVMDSAFEGFANVRYTFNSRHNFASRICVMTNRDDVTEISISDQLY